MFSKLQTYQLYFSTTTGQRSYYSSPSDDQQTLTCPIFPHDPSTSLPSSPLRSFLPAFLLMMAPLPPSPPAPPHRVTSSPASASPKPYYDETVHPRSQSSKEYSVSSSPFLHCREYHVARCLSYSYGLVCDAFCYDRERRMSTTR